MNAYPIENDKCTADVELEAFAVPSEPRAPREPSFLAASLSSAQLEVVFTTT